MTVDQQFTVLNDKLQQLLWQYNRLQKENERLKEEFQHSRTSGIESSHRVEELNQQVNILKVSSGEMTSRDKKEFEKKINQYVKEIDKCIAYLGE